MTETFRPTPGSLVWRLSLRWRTAVDRAVAPLGLTHAQYSVLASLHAITRSGARPSQRELADRTGMDAIYVSKLVRALEGNRLVARTTDPHDSRAVEVALTDEGRAVILPAIDRVIDLQDQLTAPLGGLESERCIELIETLQLLLDTPLTGPERNPET